MTKSQRPALSARLSAPVVRWGAFIAFIVIVACTGGGSRSDILSLVLLRPLAVGFAAFALFTAPAGAFAVVRTPLVLLAALAMVIAAQLVPLPPSLWSALPGREAVAALDLALQIEQVWRPITLSPSGAWNALFSLVVPAAAIAIYASLERGDRSRVISAWVGVAAASALLGLAQLFGHPEGPLYLYAQTNPGVPVGLFANGNHQAVMLASAIPLVAIWAVRRRRNTAATLGLAAVFAIGLFAVALLTGSRSGGVLAMIGLGLALAVLWQSWTSQGAGRSEARRVSPIRRHVPVMAALAALLALAAAALWSSAGMIGLVAASPQEEVRLAALPTMLSMLQDVWIFGVGGGAFARAYQIFEPAAMLSPYYLNHAHNDWLEIAIEYGMAGILLLVALTLLVFSAARQLWRRPGFSLAERCALLAPPAFLAAASLLDYPLRVPTVQVMAVLWLLYLYDGAPGARPPSGNRR